MKAFRLVAPGKTELCDIPKPKAGLNEVVLRVGAAGICHSDLHMIATPPDAAHSLPMTLGHEIAGWIDELGPGVEGYREGDAVAVYGIIGCDRCSSCLRGESNRCRTKPVGGIGLNRDGGIAEYVSVPVTQLMAIGDLDVTQAAPLTDAALTPYHAIQVSRENLRPGSWCVVIGAGGLGHMALQILAATTAVRVIAIDNDEEALIRAKALGAVHAFTSDESAVGKIRELVGPAPNGADVVLDFVCITPTLEIARKVVATGGNLTMVGLGAGELRMVPGVVADLPVPMETQVRIPFWGTKAELHEVLELGRTQKIQVRTEIYSIEQASEVYRKLAMREIRGRAVIVPQR